ncbi:hypothetical protein N7478_009878 [Penicillium angulare]|uniref:uncharacterized protein n=1 Tax=Penicillium angulare TaxID=116970 RepID=UPI002542217B|nr:uncharacterized protein N7478_009878 [Penicillium angulare]KAJ5267070.1 hypothetical protein N7478_009878 [Penicillium angulare]
MPSFHPGQTVNYKPVGGPNSNTSSSKGIIRDVATKPGATLTGRSVSASEQMPSYQVRATHFGKAAMSSCHEY